MQHLKKQRSNKEYILLAMSFGGAVAILPFAIHRLYQQEWLVAAVDLFMVMGMVFVGSYVLRQGETRRPAILLALVALAGVSLVIYLKGPSTVYWAYPTMVGMYFILQPLQAVILSGITSLLVMLILVGQLEFMVFMAVFITLLVNNVFAYIFARGMYQQSDQLTEMTRVDPLTGAGNRRALDERLKEVTSSVKRVQQDISLIFIDLDHFKQVNDNFGHGVGDQVLIQLVALVEQRIRETDSIYRLGGEEFVVLAMGAGDEVIHQLANELRLLIEQSYILEDYPVTASLGVAVYQKDEPVGSWLERADMALYQAKQAGRNRVCFAQQKLSASVISFPGGG